MALKQLTADFINRFIEECKKPDNFDKIKTNLIDHLFIILFGDFILIY